MARSRSNTAYVSPEWFGDVLCGWCDYILAQRSRGHDGPNGEERYYVALTSGMLPKSDGLTWALTKRAEKKQAQGKAPAVHRQTGLSHGVLPDEVKRQALARGKLFRVGDGTEQVPSKLPIRVECPGCGHSQLLASEPLEVDNTCI